MAKRVGEITRENILQGVLMVIASHGIDAVTHRRVGLEAGLSNGVVSYHFPTRDELIYQAFKFHLGSVEEYAKHSGFRADTQITPRHVVDVLTKAVAADLADPATVPVEHALVLYAARHPELAELFNSWESEVVETLAKYLKKVPCNNPKNTARILVGLMRGFLLETLTNPSLNATHFRRRVKPVVETLLLPVA